MSEPAPAGAIACPPPPWVVLEAVLEVTGTDLRRWGVDDRVIAWAQTRMMRSALTDAGWTVHELWWAYAHAGGEVGRFEVEAFLHGALHLHVRHRNCLVQIANQVLPQAEIPYTWDFPAVEGAPGE